MSRSYAQFQTDRDTAGAAYAAAAQAYITAWETLSAYDKLIADRNVGGDPSYLETFNDLPLVMMHPAYLTMSARDAMVSPNVVSPAARTLLENLIATWSGS